MHNVIQVLKCDIRALTKNATAILVVLTLCFLPALYAWFNVYSNWEPYNYVSELPVAVVSSDRDYMDNDGEIVNMGRDLVEELRSSEDIGYVILDDPDEAVSALYRGEYYAAIIIEPDFTYNMYNFLSMETDKPTITFYQNEKVNAAAVMVLESTSDNVKRRVNEMYVEAIVETLFDKLNDLTFGAEGSSPAERLVNALNNLKQHFIQYSQNIDMFIKANDILCDTLAGTGSTLNYTIYLIGNEKVNINQQIAYADDTRSDLELINAQTNTFLLGLQDAIDDAVYKLHQLDEGTADKEEVQASYSELERQYAQLIDYIKYSGIGGSEVDDALSALNTVSDKITTLGQSLGLIEIPEDDTSTTQSLKDALNIDSIVEDFENITVPEIYDLLTGYSYYDLSSASSSPQSLESIIDYMSADTDSRIQSIQYNISLASTSESVEERKAALEAAKNDNDILKQELEALAAAGSALAVSSGDSQTADSVNKTVNEATAASETASEAIKRMLNGDRNVDLPAVLESLSDSTETTRVALTEVVYPALDSMISNLQDTMGEVSSILQDFSGVLGKATPILDRIAATFGTVNETLYQVQVLLSNYCNRVDDLIDLVSGTTENNLFSSVTTFFKVDPESIGQFFSSPVKLEKNAVFPVSGYGAAMTPFYTAMAIWMACVMLNAMLRFDPPKGIIGITKKEAFFGRYLTVLLINQIQVFIILTGNMLIFDLQCLHPGLFYLTGMVTSLAFSMLTYAIVVALGNIGKLLVIVLMIIQIAGSGGSYPIELLPDFFQQVYMFFPFPYAVNAMREAIAGIYQHNPAIFLLKLSLFFVAGLLIGLIACGSLGGLNHYMQKQLKKTELM